MHTFLSPSFDLSPLWISLKVSLLATSLTCFAGIAVAYWMLNYRGGGKALLDGILISPLVLPPTVVGFLLLLLFGKNGFVGNVLRTFDFSIVFTWYGAVITAMVVSFPLMYRTALGAFEQVDKSLFAVARTLGASEWVVFYRVMLPLALPGVLAGAVLAFARALGEFGATLMLAGNIPGQTQTIPMAIYFAVEAGAMDEAWFWAVVIMLLSLSGIFAINFWQKHHMARRSRLRRSGQSSAILPQSLSSVAIAPLKLPPHQMVGLLVDIQKQRANFDLNLAFNVTDSTLGILGGSGAGKSLLLQCIAGMETPTRGRIILNGRVLFDAKKGINVPSCDRKVGFLVQNYALFPNMTVAKNIAFGLPKHLSKRQVKDRVEELLSLVQLSGDHTPGGINFADRYPHQLSGGQQQRVALARVLASEPEVILLDEPFSALDTHLRNQMEQEIKVRLREFPGVSLFVTHNLEEAYRVCENLLVLDAGHAIAHGSKYEVFERPGSLAVAQLTGCKNISVATAIASQQVFAVDWGILLNVTEALPAQLAYIGFRAHQIRFIDTLEPENTFPCWLVFTSETPHRMTLFLKFNAPPTHLQDYDVQAEVFKEKWNTLKQRPQPIFVQLEALKLILLEA